MLCLVDTEMPMEYSSILNKSGNWWSTTEYNNTIAHYRRFVHTSAKVIRDDHNKRDGFSVRCIKNNETD